MIVKNIFFLALMVLTAVSLPLNDPSELLTYSSSRSLNGYDFSYSTDGQSRDEHAVIVLQKDGDKEVEVLEVRGSYSFLGDDNRYYTVNYVSGIDGYRANLTITDNPPDSYNPSDINNPNVDDLQPPAALPPNAIISLVG